MDTQMSDATESEVRALRVAIYGPISDESWVSICENWMRDDSIEWLRVHQPNPKPKRP